MAEVTYKELVALAKAAYCENSNKNTDSELFEAGVIFAIQVVFDLLSSEVVKENIAAERAITMNGHREFKKSDRSKL